jgi:hypothetical protein
MRMNAEKERIIHYKEMTLRSVVWYYKLMEKLKLQNIEINNEYVNLLIGKS